MRDPFSLFGFGDNDVLFVSLFCTSFYFSTTIGLGRVVFPDFFWLVS